jgi:hypothetical protein
MSEPKPVFWLLTMMPAPLVKLPLMLLEKFSV